MTETRIPAEGSATTGIARNAVLGSTALVIVLLLVGATAILWRSYFDAIDDARVSTANLAIVLDEHAQRTLRVVEVTVEGLADTLDSGSNAGPWDVDRIARLLASRKRVTKELLNIFLVDADGRSVTDGFGSRDPLDLNGRPYVKFHRESSRDGIFISEPAMSLAGRGRIVVVSHRLSNADGSFRGIVGASVTTAYFQDFYRSIDVGPMGVVTLRTHSGAIVARQPANEASLKDEVDAPSTVADSAAAGQSSGTGDYTGRNDGIRRITSFRAVAGSPYIVSVGRAHADFLAPWWRDLRRYVVIALILVAAAMAACWTLLRQMAARERADAAKLGVERTAAEVVRQSAAQEHQVHERLETILNRMPLGCMMTDADLRMTYWNPAAERIFGCSFEDVKGLAPFETGFILTDRATAEAQHEKLRRGEVSGYTVAKSLTRDGRTIICEWTNTPLMGADGVFRGAIALCQDITERSNTEEVLRQSAKMDTLGQLTGGVAHDFNNLLTIIVGNVELAEFALKDRPAETAALQMILGAALRGAELTRQLLAFARRQTLAPKVVRINELVEGMTRLLSRTIGENVEIALKTSPEVWAVEVDPTQLESALVNLAVNARDAMPDGGKLIIETANAPLDEVYAAQHSEVTAGDYVALSVSDTGTGMTPETVARVFEPFFTTKEPGKGTGLGMSMVFGLVKQSGGHIKIYSEAGHGTTVRLYLPRASTAAVAPSQATSVEKPAASKHGEVVLLVEDDTDVREVVVQTLRRLGYGVLEAGNGPMALEILDRGGRIDLLFTDMVMPGGMSGADVALRARRSRPDLKVLLTSGYTAPALAARMRQIDGAMIISKPYRIADLARKIRESIDQA